jgi:hypothetical protein
MYSYQYGIGHNRCKTSLFDLKDLFYLCRPISRFRQIAYFEASASLRSSAVAQACHASQAADFHAVGLVKNLTVQPAATFTSA